MDRYLVELSRPEAGWTDIQAVAARARDAAQAIGNVRFLRAIYMPEDGTCGLLFEGASIEAVREAGTRAGGSVARLTRTVGETTGGAS